MSYIGLVLSLLLVSCSSGAHAPYVPPIKTAVSAKPDPMQETTPPEVRGTGCIVTSDCAEDKDGKPVETVVCPSNPTGD